MVKSDYMRNRIYENLADAGFLCGIDKSVLDIILSTIEEETSKRGYVCVEGEWSVVPNWMIESVKKELG